MASSLLEREGAAASIGAALSRAGEGHGAALFLVGEAGLGKTSLLQLTRTLAGAAFDCVLGRGDAAEATLPFGIVSQALAEAAGPGLPRLEVVSPDARGVYFYAALRALQKRKRPLLLALDDLHWADRDSLDLVAFLCRRIGNLPVAIVGTLRPWPAAALDTVGRIAGQDATAVERLAPLSQTSTAALLSELLHAPVSADQARPVWEFSGGNPFLLEQAATLLARDGAIDPSLASAMNGQARLLLSRFAGLSDTELRYAQAASIFGPRFRPSLVHPVAGLPPIDGDRAMEALCRAGLARGTDEWAEFVHPLFAQVLYEDLPSPVRARSHAAAFRVLTDHRADPAEVAEHAIRGKLFGDPEVVEILTEAGRRAIDAGAIGRAREHFQNAFDLAGESPPAALLLALGETQLGVGDPRAAIVTFTRLLAFKQLQASTRISARHGRARALAIIGSTRESEAEFVATTEDALTFDRHRAFEILLDHAQGTWLSGGAGHAAALATRARSVAETLDQEARDRAGAAWAFCAFHMGDPSGIDMAREAALRAEADPVGQLASLAWNLGTFGTYLLITRFTERFDEGERMYQAAFRAAEGAGLPTAICMLPISHADALLRLGRLEEALARMNRAGELIELYPLMHVWEAIARAEILLEMGRLGESREWCQRAETLAVAHRGHMPVLWIWLGFIQAQHLAAVGRLDEAATVYENVEQIAREGQILEPCVVPWAGAAIESFLACDRVSDVRRVLSTVESVTERLPCRWPRTVIATSRAALAEREGDRALAESRFNDALALHADMEMPLAEAETLIRYGGFLRRGRESRRARAALSRALDIAERVGAGRLAAVARSELWAAGGRHRRKVGVDELTPQEARVAELAQEGLSDKQIAQRLTISAKTVDAHLQHIYRKLGVSSRRELMRRPVATSP